MKQVNNENGAMARHVSIGRDHEGRATITYWADIERSDDCVTITAAPTRTAWKDAMQIARTLRRVGHCCIFSNGVKTFIGGGRSVAIDLAVG